MFKGIVGKAVKNLLIDPITNPPEPPSAPVPEPAAPPARTQPAVVSAQRAEDTLPRESPPPARIELETYGIDLPYHPGEGSECGAACRCRWQIDKRWSEVDNAFAIHVTWQSSGDATVCPDCQQRASEWNDVLVRFIDD